MTTLEGQAFRCVSSGPRPEMFDQWVSIFRTTDEARITVRVVSTGGDPGYKVGDRYRLDVVPVALFD